MIRTLSLGTVAVLGLALLACGKQTGSNGVNAAALNQAAYPGLAGATPAPAPAMSPQDFATAAATSDAFEIEAARMAKDKARDPDVKSFANMMITDHTRSTNQLKSIASGMHPPLDTTPRMSSELTKMLDELKGLSGHDFDSRYVAQQVSAHESALSMLQNYAARGTDARLKDFASKTAGVVQKHLDAARELMTR